MIRKVPETVSEFDCIHTDMEISFINGDSAFRVSRRKPAKEIDRKFVIVDKGKYG